MQDHYLGMNCNVYMPLHNRYIQFTYTLIAFIERKCNSMMSYEGKCKTIRSSVWLW